MESCCFCIELRVGCLIIGYLNLIGNIIAIFMGISGMVVAGTLASHGEDKEQQSMGTSLLIITIILMVLFILSFAFTIVLLVGIHQNKRGLVKAFLIYSVIFLAVYIIMFFASFVSGHIKAENVISDILSIFLSFYFLLMIKSYHEKMDNPANKPAVYNTA